MTDDFRAYLPEGKSGDPVEEAKAQIAAAMASKLQAQNNATFQITLLSLLNRIAVALEASIPKFP